LIYISVDGFADLVELKKSVLARPILLPDASHKTFYPSQELSRALAQAMHYLQVIEDHRLQLVKLVNIPVLRPTITIIIGRSNDWDDPAKEQLRILNSTPLEHQSSYVRSPACDGEYFSIVRAGGRNPILTGAFYSGSKVAVNQGSMMPLHRGASELLDLLSRNSDVSDCFTRTQ